MNATLKWICFGGGMFNGFVAVTVAGLPAVEFELVGIACLICALFFQGEERRRP